jgi:chorismate mutase/prephenate dehydratase
VFRVVESGNAHYGVVPIENSTEGAIGRSLDLLLSSPLQICGEINLPIHHNLMGRGDDRRVPRASTRTPNRWRNATNG